MHPSGTCVPRTLGLWVITCEQLPFHCCGPHDSVYLVQNLDSSCPRLKMPDGSWVEGRYEETIGTALVFLDDTQTGGATGERGSVRYLCKTEQRLCFTK